MIRDDHNGPHRHRWRTHHHHGRPRPDAATRTGTGLRAVLLSLAILGVTALVQGVLFLVTDSVALLADLIHNAGDALTALPLGIAFLVRSARAERIAGHVVILVIFATACIAFYEAVLRLIEPRDLENLAVLAAAGIIGAAGNALAAVIRLRAGRAIGSAALSADGEHARADAIVSLGVVAGAALLALGLRWADPVIGLAITMIILRITWHAWRAVRAEGDSSTLPA